jgi:hypothetical protein
MNLERTVILKIPETSVGATVILERVNQPSTKIEKDEEVDLVTASHSILNRWNTPIECTWG